MQLVIINVIYFRIKTSLFLFMTDVYSLNMPDAIHVLVKFSLKEGVSRQE